MPNVSRVRASRALAAAVLVGVAIALCACVSDSSGSAFSAPKPSPTAGLAVPTIAPTPTAIPIPRDRPAAVVAGAPISGADYADAVMRNTIALVATRVIANLLLGGVGDIGYASVFGASNIHEGWPLYVQDHNHLDTYGPITYLAYLPFELAFPLHNLRHDYLPAAHAAAITFDLLSIFGLFVLGRRLRAGDDGRRLGLVLAFAWAASPFTFLNLVANTNDGLVPLFVIWALVAVASPVRRGILLGLGAAAKFAPLALAGLFATANGDRGRRTALFAVSMGAAVALPILAYAKPGGLGVFWSQTLGFQFQRHSFLSIWGQYPQIEPLKVAIQAGTAALAVAASIPVRRRTTAQVGALAGAILIALQLSAVHWYFFYIAWFMPGVLLAVLAVGGRAPREAEHDGAGLDEWAPALTPPGAAAPASHRAALS